MSSPIFPDRKEEDPLRVESAELVVGIPSLNEADSIQHPTTIADQGLKRFFPDKKGVIINCDNASPDNTREAFLGVPTETPKIYLSTPEGVLGKGNNLFNLFQRVLELGAKGAVVVDADVESITPKWIGNLAAPLFDGYDFVAPVYVRHRYEWTIANNIIYPLTRSLYGRRVREPMGGDFAVSAKLAERLLGEPRDDHTKGFGINTWITTLAVVSDMPFCQTFLGGPRVHKVKENPADVLPLFSDNCAVLFSLAEKYYDYWKDIKWSKPIPIFGFDEEAVAGPRETQIHSAAHFEEFKKGLARFQSVWKQILHRDVYWKLQEISGSPMENFEFPHLLWALTLYDYAVAFKRKTLPPERCMESLLPLYSGRVCSVAHATAHMDLREMEVYIEDQCRVFEETKQWLKQLWR